MIPLIVGSLKLYKISLLDVFVITSISPRSCLPWTLIVVTPLTSAGIADSPLVITLVTINANALMSDLAPSSPVLPKLVTWS